MIIKNFVYILLILVFQIIEIKSDCSYSNAAGAVVNLENLGVGYQTTFSNNNNYNAYFSLCGTYADLCKTGNLAAVDSTACQKDSNGNFYQLGSSNAPTVGLTDSGFKATFSSSMTTGGCSGGRVFIVQTSCDQTVDLFTSDPAQNGESPQCTYNVYGRSKYACKTCDHLNNCNGHGTCNINSGACVCYDQFNGTTCSNSRIEIFNVVTSATIKGGSITINGYFGTTSENLIVTYSLNSGDNSGSNDDDEDLLCSITSKTSTTIVCNVGPGEGTYNVKVDDNGYGDTLEDAFTYQYLVCDPACNSIHGGCDKYEGVCQCDDQTQGNTCSDSKLSIDSVSSTSILGGDVTINGYFGTAHSLEVLIGSSSCLIISNSSSSIKCSIGPGQGTFDVKVIDRDLSVLLQDSFTYELLPCIPECNSIHGTCNGNTGQCECDSQTSGAQCQNSKLYLSAVSSTTVEGGTVYLYGYFGTITPLFNVTIGELLCQDVKSLNDTVISCNIGPGTGYQDVVVSDNDLTSFGKNYFKYFKIVFDCPNNCTLNGDCNNKTGSCSCYNGYTGFDCSSILNTNKPSLPTIDLKTGSASISNENFNFQLNIISLAEISIDGSVVKEHSLTNISNIKPTIIREGDGKNIGIIALFTQYIESVDCTIEYTIEEVIGGKSKEFNFAGVTFSVEPGSLKTSINISNYQFESNLNTLQLRINSTIDKSSLVNNCNSQSLQVNSDQLNIDSNFNYLQVSKDSKMVVSRFLSKIISDGRISPTSTSLVSSNNETLETILGLNLPHFNQYTTLDPDFGVLLSKTYKDKCGKSNNYKIITISVVVPCVAVITIFVVAAVLYKKHYLRIALFKNSLTDKSKNKRRSLHL